jgi:O-antigen/teichoic acid export membrane protein
MVAAHQKAGFESQYGLNVLAQGAGKAVSFGANFLSFVVIARLGGTDFFGQYSWVLTFLGIFAVIADFGTSSVLARDIAQVEGSQAGLYWGNFLLLRLTIGIAVIPIALGAAYFLRRDLLSVLIVGSLAIPILAARFFDPIFQVNQKPWCTAYTSIAYGITYTLLLAGALLLSSHMMAFIGAYLIANTVYVILAFSLSRNVLKAVFRPQWTIIKGILSLSIPLGISHLFVIVNSRVPILMLASIGSDHAVAVYNAAYRFVELTAMGATILITPLVPVFSARAKRNPQAFKKLLATVIELMAIITIPVAVAAPFVSPWLITTLFGPVFADSAHAFNILIWVCVIVFFSLASSAAALAIGYVKFAYWNTAGAACISILLNYLLIPDHGYLAPAWAALVCECFLATVSFYFVIRRLGNVFRGLVWSKIIGVNISFALILHSPLNNRAVFPIVLALIYYTLAIWYCRIVSLSPIKILLKRTLNSIE